MITKDALPENVSVGKLDNGKEMELNGLNHGVTYIDLWSKEI
jgi:hypothetical protein